MFLYVLFLLNIFCIGYLSAMENQGSGSIKPLATYVYKKRGLTQTNTYKLLLDGHLTSPQSIVVKNSELETVNEPNLSASHDEPPVKKQKIEQKVVYIQPAPESSNVTITEINGGANSSDQKKEKQSKAIFDSQNKQERKILSWMFRSAASNKFAAKRKSLEQYGTKLSGGLIQCKLCQEKKVLESGYFVESHIGQHQGLWDCPYCKLNAASKAILKEHAPICRMKPS